MVRPFSWESSILGRFKSTPFSFIQSVIQGGNLLKLPRTLPEIISLLESGRTVPVLWDWSEVTPALIAAGYDVIFLTQHVPVLSWHPKNEPYGSHLDRFRKAIVTNPILLDRLYAMKGKPIRGPLDAVLSVCYWLDHYTREELLALPDDFDVKYNAANGKAAAMLKKHLKYVAAKQASRAAVNAKAEAKRQKYEKAAEMGITVEELEVIEAAAAEAAAAEAAAAKLAKKEKKSKSPASNVSTTETQNPKPAVPKAAPAPVNPAPKPPAPPVPPKGETKIPPLRMGLSRRSKPATEGDPS